MAILHYIFICLNASEYNYILYFNTSYFDGK